VIITGSGQRPDREFIQGSFAIEELTDLGEAVMVIRRLTEEGVWGHGAHYSGTSQKESYYKLKHSGELPSSVNTSSVKRLSTILLRSDPEQRRRKSSRRNLCLPERMRQKPCHGR